MTEPSATTSVGTLLNGTYLLERVIAEGGMGMVYEAQHLRLPRKFAVKVLGKPKDLALAETALPRFRREAEIAATLQHPHIVETFDFQVSENGSPYLVMELLDGEDLSDRLKRHGRIPVAGALRVIEEIAEALDVAHGKGVVHRDLKPANIFLSRRPPRDDFVKVLDFGVSKLIDAATLTQEKAMVGTPLYMSPEQAVGTQELTAESDVFSLGAIAYEILTGRRAFAASSIPSILYQIVHGPTPTVAGRAPGLTVELDVVFAKVLAKKKKDRFARSSDFAAALREALEKPAGTEPADWVPPDLGGPADDRGSGVIRAGLTAAGMTEVDSSTKAGEAMPSAPHELSAPPPLTGPSLLGPFTGMLFPGRKRAWLLALAGVGLGLFALTLFVVIGRDPPTTVAVPAPKQPASAPVVETPPLEFAPDPVAATPPPQPPANVQFTFHVVPKGAQITVDEKRVKGQHLVVSYQKEPRRVKLVAPGYHTMTMTIPSTANRTFEVHMERLARIAPQRPAPKPDKLHHAAPVQDL